jgi:hypothetical protein
MQTKQVTQRVARLAEHRLVLGQQAAGRMLR